MSFHGKSIGKKRAFHQPQCLRWRSPRAIFEGWLLNKHQFSKRLRYVKIRHCSSGRPPRGIKPWLRCSFDPVKIYFPCRSAIELPCQTLYRDCQLRDPRLGILLKNHSAPHPALQVVLSSRSDVQINPISIGTDLELFVPTKIRGVGLQKHFCHIAIPKLVAPPIAFGVRKNGNCAVFRPESQK